MKERHGTGFIVLQVLSINLEGVIVTDQGFDLGDGKDGTVLAVTAFAFVA